VPLDSDEAPPMISTHQFEICDMSKKEAKEFEKQLTTIQIFRDQLLTAVATTECIEKSDK